MPHRDTYALLEDVGGQQGISYRIADVRAWAFVVMSTVVVTYAMFLAILQRFRVYLLDTNRVLDFVVILLYFSLEHKLDPSKKRMCYDSNHQDLCF